jgi:hypothetical protein
MAYSTLEKKEMKLKVVRDDDNNTAELVITELEDASIKLANESVDDIKILFEKIFVYIVKEKKLINFQLEDQHSKDLFQEVADDIVSQLNSEINQSETDFIKILNLSQSE